MTPGVLYSGELIDASSDPVLGAHRRPTRHQLERNGAVMTDLRAISFQLLSEGWPWRRRPRRGPDAVPDAVNDGAAREQLARDSRGLRGDTGGADPAKADALIDPSNDVGRRRAEDSGDPAREGIGGKHVGDLRG